MESDEGFMGIGGKNSNQQNQSIGNLNNLFNFGMNAGQNAISSGNSALGAAGSYWSSLLSGNKANMNQAVAPETNAIASAGDAQRRQQASLGTARGGGVSGGNQQQQTSQNAAVDNALFSARPAAAAGATQVGGAQIGEGTNLLNTASSATANAGKIATDARTQAAQEQQQVIKDIFGFGGNSV